MKMNPKKVKIPVNKLSHLVHGKTRKKAGSPPGSLIYTGHKKVDTVKLSYLQYNAEICEEKTCKKIEDCIAAINANVKTWINIDGLHEVEIVENAGKVLDLHPLLLEDILSTDQRPKIDEYENNRNIFIVIRMFYFDKAATRIESEQISIVLGDNYIITFQEKEGDVFEPVRERLRGGRGRIRNKGVDYLTYALIDAVVDNYFSVLEEIGNQLEDIESELIESFDEHLLKKIHGLKRELILLRKSVWPLREVVGRYEKGDLVLVQKTTRVFVRDLYDHTIQVMDTIETYRDILSGLHDMYMTRVSNRMNEIMKMLTIIATIFIPLTFIVGVYGMNFEYIPELRYRYSYFITWGVMIIVALIMVVYFRKKKWL